MSKNKYFLKSAKHFSVLVVIFSVDMNRCSPSNFSCMETKKVTGDQTWWISWTRQHVELQLYNFVTEDVDVWGLESLYNNLPQTYVRAPRLRWPAVPLPVGEERWMSKVDEWISRGWTARDPHHVFSLVKNIGYILILLVFVLFYEPNS